MIQWVFQWIPIDKQYMHCSIIWCTYLAVSITTTPLATSINFLMPTFCHTWASAMHNTSNFTFGYIISDNSKEFLFYILRNYWISILMWWSETLIKQVECVVTHFILRILTHYPTQNTHLHSQEDNQHTACITNDQILCKT